MKRFNLLSEPWIPVKTHHGANKLICAFEIAQKEIKALDAPRADFNAALMQFLIGLLQTTMAPKDAREWRQRLNNPPAEIELKGYFNCIEPAFYLSGDDRLFMQDPFLSKSKKIGQKRPIEEIIFGAPGESGKSKNIDYFVKKNHISGLCFSCSASALLTANIFAEDGGRGYYPSMRGNGYISNLVQVDENQSNVTLWKNIWFNIMENGKIDRNSVLKHFLWTKDFPDKPYLAKIENYNLSIKKLKSEKRSSKDKEMKSYIDMRGRGVYPSTSSLTFQVDLPFLYASN